MKRTASKVITSTVRLVLALSVGLGTGCTASSSDDEASAAADGALRRGTVTADLPQVGIVITNPNTDDARQCTASLVGARTVLTAAHCVGYASVAVGSATGSFKTYDANGVATRSRSIDGYVSFGRSLGSADLALVHLQEPIDDLEPLTLGGAEPSDGESVDLYGFGIYDCEAGESGGHYDGRKRVFSYAWNDQPHALCDGDSGGPLIAAGAIAAVASWGTHVLFIQRDGFANVWTHRDELTAQIARWN